MRIRTRRGGSWVSSLTKARSLATRSVVGSLNESRVFAGSGFDFEKKSLFFNLLLLLFEDNVCLCLLQRMMMMINKDLSLLKNCLLYDL